MKTTTSVCLVIFIIIFDYHFLKSQDINVHCMIGKKQNEVINKYGNPVHKDNSNPAMICMFYKTKVGTMIFVSNKADIYQSEATKSYDTKIDAQTELDACISKSVNDGFMIDSVTVTDFRLRRKGIKADLMMIENKLSNKFEIRMKANKSED